MFILYYLVNNTAMISKIRSNGGIKLFGFKDKHKASNEKSGNKYTSDASIGMDNFVVRNNADEIWLVALSLGDDKYIRMKAFDDAVTGEDLIKIAKEFATKLK